MSHYKRQEFDFIQRTQKIIGQYNSLHVPEQEKFEITLLLNCMVGLLILPQQHWFKNLPASGLSHEEWGIKDEHISFIKEGSKTVNIIAKHLRNSIAHYKFSAFDDITGDINSINFEDYYRSKLTFKANVPVPCLRQFTTKLIDTLMSEMNEVN